MKTLALAFATVLSFLHSNVVISQHTFSEAAGENEFSWMARIFSNDQHLNLCGGTLIDERWVLTAAHCLPAKVKEVGIELGRYNTSRANEEFLQQFTSSEFHLHPQYKHSNYDYDFALIKLPWAAQTTDGVIPIALPSECFGTPFEVAECPLAIGTGWGVDNTGRKSVVLKKTRFSLKPYSECQRVYGTDLLPNSDNRLCAEGHGGVDSCKGDSGGPLMCYRRYYGYSLIGVTSMGVRCIGRTPSSTTKFPAVYGRICTVAQWINSKVDQSRPVGCSEPEPVENGYFRGSGTHHQANRRIVCYWGFHFNGPEVLKCLNGEWRPPPPYTCVPDSNSGDTTTAGSINGPTTDSMMTTTKDFNFW